MKQARTTKEEIVQILKRHGEQTVGSLAESLEITEMAVRRHLSKLEKEQVIQSKMVRQHVGRPTYVYALSERGEDSFPKDYKKFALEMLEDLEQIGDETLVNAILKARTNRMEEQLQKRVSRQDNVLQKLREVAIMQEENGYMVQVKQEEKSYILQKQNCPLKAVAEKYPQLCLEEENMYKRLFSDENVKVLSNMCDGDCHCSYHIQEKK
ncbi:MULTISPECIES: helix-turn-helix transcriptional regulator [Bacillus cereus group]|jgi:predicted ArsR family transcriptional regulator|uniref:helix-turn-helix transcriptional regulator n=1 Tax=Bacillus cereus group TaxID=86661 RepID=UPI0001A0AC9B|nr:MULTISPECIES: methanogen output domain 1-containing protein [Bacillus cereus group]EEL48750.1 Transcriptional regulator, DeoR [Bacillus cereus Rock3-44]PFA19605.1 transcriptional regulator [Bacillus cereus]PFO81913.1 transcriptional regulator [Bacillus cereus]PFR29428.1 transcriptional regulator [Bacillus cereus]PGZ15101.1 transcriptional regulator [Bacillus cereus]